MYCLADGTWKVQACKKFDGGGDQTYDCDVDCDKMGSWPVVSSMLSLGATQDKEKSVYDWEKKVLPDCESYSQKRKPKPTIGQKTIL